MTHVPMLPAVVVLTAAMIAAVTDVWKFKVYNTLTVPLLLSGLAYQAFHGGAAGFLDGVMGGLFGFGVLIFVYAMGGMGAGDVKLMAAIGTWLGMQITFYVFLASALASGGYAVILMVLGGGLRETWVNLQIVFLRFQTFGLHLGSDDRVEVGVRSPGRHRRLVPFGAMVAVGFAATLLWFS